MVGCVVAMDFSTTVIVRQAFRIFGVQGTFSANTTAFAGTSLKIQASNISTLVRQSFTRGLIPFHPDQGFKPLAIRGESDTTRSLSGHWGCITVGDASTPL